MTNNFNLEQHMMRMQAFSKANFGPGTRTEGLIDHVKKELNEIAECPKVDAWQEWLDVIILGLDGFWRSIVYGEGEDNQEIRTDDYAFYNVGDILVDHLAQKQTKNELRNWPDWRSAEPGKAIEHVRGYQD